LYSNHQEIMINRIRSLVLTFGLALATGLFASDGTAQNTLPTDQAEPFIGNWALNLEGGPEPIVLQLTVRDEGGQVGAEVGSLMGGPNSVVSSIVKSGEDLVLSYSADFQGTAIPVAITLVPGADGMKASVDFAGGQFTVAGSAAKQP
jgi:hypothetical protein